MEMKIGQVYKIAGKAHELYNITDNLLHFAKLCKNGQKLSWKNAQNLMNLTVEQFENYKELGAIEAA
jgi:hypothetical protein